MDGLDEEHDALVEKVMGRDNPMHVRDLYTRLLSTEQRIESHHSTSFVAGPHSTHAARLGGRSSRFTTPAQHGPSASGYTPAPRSTRLLQQSSGDGGGGRGAGPRPVCQMYGDVGYVATCYFKRFQKDFFGMGNDGRFTARQLAMPNHVSYGHTQSLLIVASWYMDTGATDHLTSKLGKMQVKETVRGRSEFTRPTAQVCVLIMLVKLFYPLLPLAIFISTTFFMFPKLQTIFVSSSSYSRQSCPC